MRRRPVGAPGAAQTPADATHGRCARDRQPVSYFLRRARATERFAALKEIPARIAFCWTAAAVRPSFLATCPVGVPDLASALSAISSRALQDAPSFGGRRAIIVTPYQPTKSGTGGSYTDQRSCARPGTIRNMLERLRSPCGCRWRHVAPTHRAPSAPTCNFEFAALRCRSHCVAQTARRVAQFALLDITNGSANTTINVGTRLTVS